MLTVKKPPANAEDIRDTGSIPGLGRSPGEGHGNPLQYSCLENPMDRGAWGATVHRVILAGKKIVLLHPDIRCLTIIMFCLKFGLFSSLSVETIFTIMI